MLWMNVPTLQQDNFENIGLNLCFGEGILIMEILRHLQDVQNQFLMNKFNENGSYLIMRCRIRIFWIMKSNKNCCVVVTSRFDIEGLNFEKPTTKLKKRLTLRIPKPSSF